MQVNVHQAKTNLSRLIALAIAGNEVVIARGNVPVVKLVPVDSAPVEKPKGPRVPGRLKGLIAFDDRFFEPLTDEEMGLGPDPNL